MSDPLEFLRCPKCGYPDEYRLTCRCGYSRAANPVTESGRKGITGWFTGFIDVRSRLLLFMVGAICLACAGYYLHSNWVNGTQPLNVELADLEQGRRPSQNYVHIGKHARCFQTMIYQAESRRKNPSDKIKWCYYPIISPSNSDYQKCAQEAEARKLGKAATPLFSPGSFVVLVRTNDFKNAMEFPQVPAIEPGISGILSSEVNDEIWNLVNEECPGVSKDSILILDKGSTPASKELLLWLFGLGVGMILLAGTAALLDKTGGSRSAETGSTIVDEFTRCKVCESAYAQPGYEAPLCAPCRQVLARRPVPPWIKLAAGMVGVLFAVSCWNLVAHFHAAIEFQRGKRLEQQGRFEEAVAQYEAARKAYPDCRELKARLGIALWKTGRFSAATELFKEVTGKSLSRSLTIEIESTMRNTPDRR